MVDDCLPDTRSYRRMNSLLLLRDEMYCTSACEAVCLMTFMTRCDITVMARGASMDWRGVLDAIPRDVESNEVEADELYKFLSNVRARVLFGCTVYVRRSPTVW